MGVQKGYSKTSYIYTKKMKEFISVGYENVDAALIAHTLGLLFHFLKLKRWFYYKNPNVNRLECLGYIFHHLSILYIKFGLTFDPTTIRKSSRVSILGEFSKLEYLIRTLCEEIYLHMVKKKQFNEIHFCLNLETIYKFVIDYCMYYNVNIREVLVNNVSVLGITPMRKIVPLRPRYSRRGRPSKEDIKNQNVIDKAVYNLGKIPRNTRQKRLYENHKMLLWDSYKEELLDEQTKEKL